ACDATLQGDPRRVGGARSAGRRVHVRRRVPGRPDRIPALGVVSAVRRRRPRRRGRDDPGDARGGRRGSRRPVLPFRAAHRPAVLRTRGIAGRAADTLAGGMAELELTLEAPDPAEASGTVVDNRGAVVAALMVTIGLAAIDSTIVATAVPQI